MNHEDELRALFIGAGIPEVEAGVVVEKLGKISDDDVKAIIEIGKGGEKNIRKFCDNYLKKVEAVEKRDPGALKNIFAGDLEEVTALSTVLQEK